MSNFIEKVCGTFPVLQGELLGYSEDEIAKIERLYGIEVQGDFRKFLYQMGRCDGGVFGDDPIILYRSAWNVRTQLLTQVCFFDDMQDNGNFEHLTYKPFVFSIESETQYFFIQTSSSEIDAVYHYDENSGKSVKTNYTFRTYLQDLYTNSKRSNIACTGELIAI